MSTPVPHPGRCSLGFRAGFPSLGPGAHQGGAGEKAQGQLQTRYSEPSSGVLELGGL